VHVSEEIELRPGFLMIVEGMDCCETNGHCEHHSYSSDPQFFAERRQETFPFNISQIGLVKVQGNAEKKEKYFKIQIL
jgi:hypothetical protein